MRRVGIYPGSFDPVHAGHLAFAETALTVAILDEVVFLPEESPREKPHVSSLVARFDALQTEVAQNDRLKVVNLSVERFTVTSTLAILQAKFKGARLSLLIGSDIVQTFQYRWPELSTLLRSVDLIIGMRDVDTVEDVEKVITSLEKEFGYTIIHFIITTPYSHMASSKLKHDAVNKNIT